ncbi:hypothetical protein HRbin20_01794 [bacterium HR20]|nr:hypothetical protein HRbin20_01794 [bacterium HR20]
MRVIEALDPKWWLGKPQVALQRSNTAGDCVLARCTVEQPVAELVLCVRCCKSDELTLIPKFRNGQLDTLATNTGEPLY